MGLEGDREESQSKTDFKMTFPGIKWKFVITGCGLSGIGKIMDHGERGAGTSGKGTVINYCES